MKLLLILFPFLIGAFAPQVLAQTTKHPRAVELEKELSRQGLEMLKGRFPGHPFMITVNIDPLMRERRTDGKGEKLPSYDTIDEEIIDEWDDPALANSALLSRVRKIQVVASVPSQLSDDEIAELKASLYAGLSLIEVRDGIEIRKRNWSSLSLDRTSGWMQLGLWLMGALVFFGGLYGLAWFSTDRLSRSYREAAQIGKGAGGGTNAPTPNAPSENPESKRQGAMPAGDLRFNDPIRTREMLSSAIRLLEEHRTFPSLEDMIHLDRFARQEPARMGAMLSEFPWATRQKIFSLSSSQEWLTALSEPGEVSLAAVDVLNRCLRVQRNELAKGWQDLLIVVWRLETRLDAFLAGLPTKDAFPILASLPKIISIPAARAAYPGAWASLLDANAVFERPDVERIEALKQRALDILPLRDDQAIERYRREKELVGFLKVADPATEKEIYTTAGKNSFLHSLRPPFFSVFETRAEVLDILVPRVRIDDWAKAMFNVNRAERREIEKRFGDKQKIRYFELLKSLDVDTPSADRLGDCREHIGRLLLQAEHEVPAAAAATSVETVVSEEAA